MQPPPPPAPRPGGTPQPAARPRIRWALGDAVLAYVVGLVASIVAAAFVVDARRPVQLVVLLAAQNAAIIGYAAWAARSKGLGSLRADFGFVVRARDAVWFFYGVLLQVAAVAAIAVLVAAHGDTAKQEVVRVADRAQGAQVVLIVLGVAVLAPVTEELLFRGMLLRSLLRRTDPGRAVLVGALAFGLVHALGDPSVGTLFALPVVTTLGVISGYQAVRTGELSRSILLHMGFNALTVTLLFL